MMTFIGSHKVDAPLAFWKWNPQAHPWLQTPVSLQIPILKADLADGTWKVGRKDLII